MKRCWVFSSPSATRLSTASAASTTLISNYSATERKELEINVVEAADAVESLVAEGLEKTQQRFNR